MGKFTDFWDKLDQDKDFEKRGPEYNIVVKQADKGVESYYFWFLNTLDQYVPITNIKKTKEVFASSESSAFWGELARRRSEQERRATSIMKHLNGMVRGLHEIVRTLRKIDERLDKYKSMDKGNEGDELALKDYWVMRVEGGTKSPSSVTGLAEKVGFASLPDLFYTTMLGGEYEEEEIDNLVKKKVEKYDIPEKVTYVLERKLTQFLRWKERTQQELKTRKEFNVKALASRLHQIKLYTEWVKPYLKAIERMQEEPEELEGEEAAALMTPYATTVLNYEIVGWNTSYSIEERIGGREVETESRNYEHYIPTLVIEFKQISKPASVKRRGRHSAYSHPGKLEITVRGRVQKAVEHNGEYVPKIIKEREGEKLDSMLDLLSNTIDSSLRALKDDLKEYVGGRLSGKEKEELLGEKEEKEEGEEEWEGLIPGAKRFDEIFKKIRERRKDMGSRFELFKWEAKKEKEEKDKAIEDANTIAWLPYKIFKQSNSWFETWTEKELG